MSRVASGEKLTGDRLDSRTTLLNTFRHFSSVRPLDALGKFRDYFVYVREFYKEFLFDLLRRLALNKGLFDLPVVILFRFFFFFRFIAFQNTTFAPTPPPPVRLSRSLWV